MPDAPLITSVVSIPSTTYRFSAALEPSTVKPFPDFSSWLTPGACVMSDVKSRLCGSNSICSARMFVARVLCLTSMTGETAITCTVSVTPPTGSAKSSVFT